MADLGANYGAVPVSTQVDVPNALANSYLLQQRQQAMQDQNALSQAVPLLQSDPQNAFATAAKTSPKAAMELLPVIQQMDKANRDKAADRSEALGRLLYSLKTQYKDPMVRKAVALSQAPALAAHDITPEQLQSADYSDAGVDLGIANVTSVKDMIAQSNNERDFGLKKDQFGLDQTKFGETVRHDKASEANSSGQLRVAQARLNQDSYAAPTMIGFTGPDGEEKQVAGIYNKKTGQYIDASTMQPVTNPQNLRVIGNATGGGRSMAMAGRVSTAALDASTDIENMSGIGTGGNMGLFSTLQNTPLQALGRTLRPQAVQDMQTTMAGLSRAMSLLGSGGMQGSDAVMKSFDLLEPQAGDTQLTVMRKLGSFRQQASNGIDAALASPMYSPAQKKQLLAAKSKIETAIPWVPSDVQKLENSGNDGASMHDVFGAKLGKGGNPSGDPVTDALLKKYGVTQ